MLFFKFIYEIYICGIFYGVFIESVRSSGWSLRIILQHGGGGARSMRPLAPPPPCWRLILLDMQAQQYGGGCAVEEGDEVDLTWRYRVVYQVVVDIYTSTVPSHFLNTHIYLHSSFTTWEGRMPTPTCCSSSLTKGTISEPHWLESRIADFYSSQAANWYVSHVNFPSR